MLGATGDNVGRNKNSLAVLVQAEDEGHRSRRKVLKNRHSSFDVEARAERTGVDVLTTNSYSSARHNLEPLGLGAKTFELNLRAVMLARDAIKTAGKTGERPVFLAGSVSNFGLLSAAEARTRSYFETDLGHGRSEITEAQARANLREQAAILADAGVDFLLAEATGTTAQRFWVNEACLATGLPVWTGFKGHLKPGDSTVRVGYETDDALADSVADLMAQGSQVATVFHSTVAATEKALAEIRRHWSGPLCVYPEAERFDYVRDHKLPGQAAKLTPEGFLDFAQASVAGGVQVIGGCCGVELDYIRPLRDALPARLPD